MFAGFADIAGLPARQRVARRLLALETGGMIRHGRGAIDLIGPGALQRISAGR